MHIIRTKGKARGSALSAQQGNTRKRTQGIRVFSPLAYGAPRLDLLRPEPIRRQQYPVPIAPTPGSKEKPALQGVRVKQRKGVAKAAAKFEPQAFRDQLVKHLESVPHGDFDGVSAKLDVLGNQLDYRKYEQQLFEILLLGGILAPGGSFVDDDAPKSSFSVLDSAKSPAEVADMRKVVEVFNKLLRRYKYLQKELEESGLPGVIQYANKFSSTDQEKLAAAVALFVSTGLVSATVLKNLKKDHITKDGTAMSFFTAFAKFYLQAESLENLTSSLRRGGMSDLDSLLPAHKQTPAEVMNHFKAAGLPGLVDFYQKQKSGQVEKEIQARLRELVADEADEDDILSYLRIQHKKAVLPDMEFIGVVWQGLFGTFDANKTPDQVVKDIKNASGLLEPFAEKGSTQVALINTIQLWAYENTKMMPAFVKILKELYSTDVLSDQSIIYWHGKGAKSQGKTQFLTQAQPLVTFLKEQEDDESDEE